MSIGHSQYVLGILWRQCICSMYDRDRGNVVQLTHFMNLLKVNLHFSD